MNGQDTYDQWLFLAGRPRILGRSGVELAGGNASPRSKTGSEKSPGQTK